MRNGLFASEENITRLSAPATRPAEALRRFGQVAFAWLMGGLLASAGELFDGATGGLQFAWVVAGLLVSGGAAFGQACPCPNAAAWWKAEGTADDSAGTNHGSLQNGATFAAGQVGQAFSLDGIDDYVSVADSPSLRPVNLTIEGWFNCTSTNGVAILVAKPLGAGFLNSFVVWLQNGVLYGHVGDVISGGPILAHPSFRPAPGQWYHIAYTFDRAANAQALYVNGSLGASGVQTKTIAYDGNALVLGADVDFGTPGGFFPGRMDEVSIYPRALSGAEILAIYNAGAGGKANARPVITCPPGVVVACNASIGPADTGTATATAVCDPSPIVTFSDNATGGPCPSASTITRTWTATDCDGNTSTCQQIIMATDECVCGVSPASMVGWWKGEGNASDSAGANHGTLQNGASFGAGRVGQAFVTDGINDYVSIPDAPALRPVDITIEGWFSFAAPPPTNTVQMLVAKAVGDANTFNNSYAFWVNGQFLRGSVGDPINGYAEPHVDYFGFNPVVDQWYHLAYTFQDSTDTERLYINAQLVKTFTGQTRSIVCDGHPVTIGSDLNAGNPDQAFPGRSDEVAIYSRALSEAEIQAIYTAGVLGKAARPVITCPPDVVVGCNASTASADTGSATATAACDPNPIVTFSDGVTGGPCPTLRIITRTWTASDCAGNTSTCQQIIMATDACQCANPGPAVGWWKGEGNANDSAGANDGTLQNGASFAAGKVGQAFITDGINDYVSILDSPSLRPNSLSIEGWFEFSAVFPTNRVQILVAKAVGDANTFNNSFAFWVNGSSLRGSVGDPINGYAEPHVDYSSFAPVVGQWYHLAYTFDNNTDTEKLYVDGQLVATFAQQTRSPVYDSHPVSLGADLNAGNPDQAFSGLLDEVAIYSRALSDGEILAIYIAGAHGKDYTAPTITFCPPDVAATCSTWQDVGVTGSASATDNCDPNPMVTFTDSVTGGPCSPTMVVTRTWRATDCAGNVAMCTQTISIAAAAVASLTTSQGVYAPGETIVVNFSDAAGNAKDWIGLYAAGAADTAYVQRLYTDGTSVGTAGLINGSVSFAGGLSSAGNYEARLFFNDSFTRQASVPFSVGAPPGAASNPSPADSATGVSLTPTLSWTAGSGASSHQVYFGTNATLGAGDLKATQSGTSYSPGLLAGLRQYYWRVDEVNAQGTTVGPVWSFTPRMEACVCGLPVAWWKAEGNAGDSVGTNQGTLRNGATFGAGQVGQAFSLDGNNDYISIADSPSLRPASLTVEGWFNFGATNAERDLVAKPLGAGSLNSFVLWLNKGVLNGHVGDRRGGGPILSHPSFRPVPGQWYHIAYVFDDAANMQALYVNGVLGASGVQSKTIAYDGNPVVLGADVDFGTPYAFFQGPMDEVSIYPRALSAAEIQALVTASTRSADTTAPMLACPGNVTVACGGSTAPSATGSATATDNCDPNPKTTFTDSVAGGPCPAPGTITRTWRATDDCGNSVTCQQVITLAAPFLTMSQAAYGPGETIVVNFANAASNAKDWIGLYAVGAADAAYVRRLYADGTSVGTVGRTHGSVSFVGGLSSAGSYEARLFFNNSFTRQASVPFRVEAPPGPASNPSPADGATGVSLTPTLSWMAGSGASSHQVYFGTDATLGAGDIKATQSGTSYSPGLLAGLRQYYWRVDEVNAQGTTVGPVWSFTTRMEACVCGLPVAWWKAEGNANDSAGTNQGTLRNGATFATGQVGQAFRLDGNNDYVRIPDSPSLRPANLTLEGWFYFTATNAERDLVTKPLGAGTLNSFALWVNRGVLRGHVGDGSGGGPILSHPSFRPVPGQWYHIAYTFDDAANTQALYVNGVLGASGVQNKTIAYDGNPVMLGADIDSGTPYAFFAGRMDEVSIYPRALSAPEIQALMAAGTHSPDATAPVLTCPGNVTVACGGSTAPSATGSATATDNCAATPTVTFTDSVAGGPCPAPGTITRTWTATDACGNSATCQQVITLVAAAPALTASQGLYAPGDPIALQGLTIVRTEQGVALEFETSADEAYFIEASADLIHWAPIATFKNAAGRTVLEQRVGPEFPQRFYRRVLTPRRE